MIRVLRTPQQARPVFNRRAALLTGAAAFASLAAPSVLRAATDPIRIGHLTPMTGFLGTLGQWAVMGIQMAADEINAGGGVNGRRIEVLSEDSINPENAATKAQRMLERDRVDFLMGEISSASALAISEVATRNKRLFVATGPRSDVLRGTRCSRYMFCTDTPNSVMVNAVGSALKRDGMVTGKRFITLTADYVFGHDLLKAAKTFLSANGAELIGDELIATDVTDFSAFILKIHQARPDVVCLNLAGNQVTNFVKQYAEFGLPYPTVGFNLNTADAWAAGMGALTGAWPTVWHDSLDTPASQAFVAAFQAKYGKLPENHAWIEYIALKIAVQAMTETGGPSSEEMIGYFETGAEFDILKARKAFFRASDHQLIQEAYPFSIKPAGAYDDVYSMMALGAAVPDPDQALEEIYTASTGGLCVL